MSIVDCFLAQYTTVSSQAVTSLSMHAHLRSTCVLTASTWLYTIVRLMQYYGWNACVRLLRHRRHVVCRHVFLFCFNNALTCGVMCVLCLCLYLCFHWALLALFSITRPVEVSFGIKVSRLDAHNPPVLAQALLAWCDEGRPALVGELEECMLGLKSLVASKCTRTGTHSIARHVLAPCRTKPLQSPT